jgi:hypothetical protein
LLLSEPVGEETVICFARVFPNMPPPRPDKNNHFHNGRAMVDVFLVIATIVGLGVLLVSGVYLIIFYQHPDDHNEAYAPKAVVLFGFVLAGATVLLLPLDVANNEGYAGTYRRNQYQELRQGFRHDLT